MTRGNPGRRRQALPSYAAFYVNPSATTAHWGRPHDSRRPDGEAVHGRAQRQETAGLEAAIPLDEQSAR